MTADRFNRAILDETGHRPWPMPESPWVMTQTWHDLLFAHWAVDPGVLRPLVPASLPVDEFDGAAWLGIVPFRMTNVAPRGMPSVPGLSAFPELNVRTYVTLENKPGVFFFSLDAASSIAVLVARHLARLPYFTAEMACEERDGWIEYRSARTNGPTPAEFNARYRAVGPATPPRPGSLEYFLTERYRLYTVDGSGTRYSLDIHHPPWPLQPAEAEFRRNTMAEAAAVPLPAEPPLLHFAKRQDMVAWPLRSLSA